MTASSPAQIWTWLQRNPVFVFTVAVPTLLAIIYYGLIASDVYISESRFVVRSPQRPVSSGIFGEILQGTGITRSQDDTYSVRDYILSRDALQELNDKLGVKAAYSSKNVDIFNRFPGLGWDTSFEEFYRYYSKQVGVDYDPVSAITVLTVRAYTAEDAKKINDLLVQMSERLVNTLNDRSRQDLIHFSEEEVRIAAEKAKDASAALFAFRNKHSIFEPDKQAAIQLEGVAKIQEELISTEAELAQLQRLSPSNPQIGALQSRADTLRKAMAAEASKVTNGNGSFSAKAPTFERLALESTFADKQLGSALAGLETARSEAIRKQLYLERLVQPNLPDKAMEPRRIRSAFTAFMLGMIAWGVVSLIVASIREHAE
jgi:capsular polysaccharide transport system permease protein